MTLRIIKITTVHDYDEDNGNHAISYLSGILLIENFQNSHFGLVPGLPSNIASPQWLPSPDSMPELESINSDTNTVSEPDEALWGMD